MSSPPQPEAIETERVGGWSVMPKVGSRLSASSFRRPPGRHHLGPRSHPKTDWLAGWLAGEALTVDICAVSYGLWRQRIVDSGQRKEYSTDTTLAGIRDDVALATKVVERRAMGLYFVLDVWPCRKARLWLPKRKGAKVTET